MFDQKKIRIFSLDTINILEFIIRPQQILFSNKQLYL